MADILANPGDYYVTVHTGEFPDGAIRGQLAPVAEHEDMPDAAMTDATAADGTMAMDMDMTATTTP